MVHGILTTLQPVKAARDCLLPAAVGGVASIGTPLRLPLAFDGPLLAQGVGVAPDATGQAGGVGRSQGRGLSDDWPDYWHAENVRLQLHQQVVDRRAPVHLEYRQRDA